MISVQKVQLFLCWWVFLEFALIFCESLEYFSTPQTFSNFVRTGTVHVAFERADLVLEIDLHSVTKAINQLCRLGDVVTKGDSLSSHVGRQIELLCEAERTGWQHVLEFLLDHGAPQSRQARFILTTILSSLAAGVAGLVLGSSHSTDKEDKLLSNQKHLVEVLRKEEHQAQMTSANIRELSMILGRFGETAALRKKAEDGAMTIIAAHLAHAKDMERLGEALEHLIIHHRLAPGIVQPSTIRDKLRQLEAKAEEKGMRLTIREPQDLYQMECSFGTFSSGILRIIVHIPVQRGEDTFHVFKYLPVPFPVRGSNTFGQATTELGRMIAVSEDRSRWFEPTQMEMDGCLRLRGYHLCSAVSQLRGRAYPSCLWGLFLGNQQMIVGQCQISAAPRHPEVWARGDNSFLVWHPEEEEFRVECQKNQRAATRFQGVRKVTLKKGCSGSNSVLSVFGSARTVFTESHTLAPPLTVNVTELRPQEVSASGAPRHFRPPVIHDARNIVLQEWNPLTDSRVLTAAGTSTAILLCLFVYLLRWWSRNRRRTSRLERPRHERKGDSNSNEMQRSSSDYALSPGVIISHNPRGTGETRGAPLACLTGATTPSKRRGGSWRPLPKKPLLLNNLQTVSAERQICGSAGESCPTWQGPEQVYESLSAVTARGRPAPAPPVGVPGKTLVDSLDPRGIGRILSSPRASVP